MARHEFAYAIHPTPPQMGEIELLFICFSMHKLLSTWVPALLLAGSPTPKVVSITISQVKYVDNSVINSIKKIK